MADDFPGRSEFSADEEKAMRKAAATPSDRFNEAVGDIRQQQGHMGWRSHVGLDPANAGLDALRSGLSAQKQSAP